MRKFLLAAAVLFTLTVAAQVEAAEFYCFTTGNSEQTSDVYVMTETAQLTSYGIKVRLHEVIKNRRGTSDRYFELGFVKKGDDIYMVWLPTNLNRVIVRGNTVLEPDYFKILQIIYNNR